MPSPLTSEQRRTLAAFVKFMRAAETVSTRIHRHLSEDGLSPTQFGVLEALFHLGPLHQGEIGRKILKSSGNITLVIDNLEKRSLVYRERDGADRRYVRISLTDRGRDLIASIFPRHVEAIARAMDALSAEEQEELARLCRKLGIQNR